ncbi:MAG: nucleotidyltransferase domain-containing protein [Muribaculaceae bacterium]|nr:nucleotidyltransferase domain-containing protein [Muribaculaceae bacterium]
MKLIELNIDKIASLCKKYKVKCLYVFGSILTDRFNSESDVDFSVDFDKESIEAEKIDWANLFFDFIPLFQNSGKYSYIYRILNNCLQRRY